MEKLLTENLPDLLRKVKSRSLFIMQLDSNPSAAL